MGLSGSEENVWGAVLRAAEGRKGAGGAMGGRWGDVWGGGGMGGCVGWGGDGGVCGVDRKSKRVNSSHFTQSSMPSTA